MRKKSKRYSNILRVMDENKKEHYSFDDALTFLKSKVFSRKQVRDVVRIVIRCKAIRRKKKKGNQAKVAGIVLLRHPVESLRKERIGVVGEEGIEEKGIKITFFDEEEISMIVKEEKEVNIDILLSTTENVSRLGPINKILGPKKLMPNKSRWTLVANESELRKNLSLFSRGQILFFEEDGNGNISTVLGNITDDSKLLKDNYEDIVKKVKAVASKKYSAGFDLFLSTTMSPSFKIVEKEEMILSNKKKVKN